MYNVKTVMTEAYKLIVGFTGEILREKALLWKTFDGYLSNFFTIKLLHYTVCPIGNHTNIYLSSYNTKG